jgi:hypothetical protein
LHATADAGDRALGCGYGRTRAAKGAGKEN